MCINKSAAGHISSGQDSVMAAIREINEDEVYDVLLEYLCRT